MNILGGYILGGYILGGYILGGYKETINKRTMRKLRSLGHTSVRLNCVQSEGICITYMYVYVCAI